MSGEAMYFRVGVFVLLGAALTASCAVILGGAQLFEEPVVVETYFDESVQGLEVGSPVKLRGVKLGSVKEIAFASDYYQLGNPIDRYRFARLVVVRMEVVSPTQAGDLETSIRANLPGAIESGLRLQLAQQGLTGTAYVEADVTDPDRNPPMEIPWTPRNLYIPSRPSAFKSFSTSAERIMKKLEDVEVEKVVLNMDKALRTLDAKLAALDVGSVNAMIRDFQVSAAELRTALKASDPDSVMANAKEVLVQIDATLARLQRVIEGGQYDLEMTLENFRVTSENLRDLTDTAKSYPSYLILGQPPDQVER